MKFVALTVALTVLYSVQSLLAAEPPLVVHEWGTFTCLQDETGRAIGGINTDDEPVPAFVHRASLEVTNSNQVSLTGGKGFPVLSPAVTMRLETPVIYFHRAAGASSMTVRVNVAFHGGWLTEFYPKAQSQAPGYADLLDPNGQHASGLTGDVVGSLDWPSVKIGIGGNLPMVQDKVWTTPRQVSTDCVTVGKESEDFLFYRGVGHIDSPIHVVRMADQRGELRIELQGLSLSNNPLHAMTTELAHAPMWLVRVSPAGFIDWSRGYWPPHGPAARNVLGEMNDSFLKTATHETGIQSLHKDMAAQLVRAGLFPDEAEAMLNTWQVSYFKSPGTRLFFLVPRSWTDRVLPLHISGSPSITRVMVGRIEIVTPRQRDLIHQIESSKPDVQEPAGMAQAIEAKAAAGEPLTKMVEKLSPADRAYVLLGRFRDALLMDEQSQRPNNTLREFIVDRLVGWR